MSGALAYLTARTVANRLRFRAAQLRRPRYLIAFVLGVAYVAGLLAGQRPTPLPSAAIAPHTAELLGGVMLVGVAVWSWTFGSERRALAFSPPEVTFLFPGPLTRRTLLHYKMVRLQLLILLNVAIWTLLLSRQGGISSWQRALALWLLLSTITLHRTGAALVRRSVAEHGWQALRHRAVSLTLAASGAAAVISGLVAALPALATLGAEGPSALVAAADAMAHAPLSGWLLKPFRMAMAPLTAADSMAWTAAVGPAVLLLLLHYVWVLRSDAAFEEAAAEWSLQRARRGADRGPSRPRGAASPTLLPLAARGRPATALVWKNLATVFRQRRIGFILLSYTALLGGLAVASLAGERGITRGAAALAVTWGGFSVLLGPQWVRNDLRRDLRQLDVLRSFPLPGRAVIAAEAAASTVSLSLIQYGLLGAAWIALIQEPSGGLTLAQRTGALAAVIVLLPLLNFVALLLQNGAALLFPAWMSAVGDGAGGLEALGQNLLATVVFALLLVLLLTPPAAIGLVAMHAVGRGPLGAAAGTLAGTVVFAWEAAWLTRWLGKIYDRTDASAPGVTW
ncbi:MAG TPA: putative ABC exporter domain-containing protein [Gemmatimonadales bacterium]|nr:putative ABC exporter domain-containing protein [Gemmatimonadales bacterium]